MKQALAFFGAFNPPTLAHLELAEYALAGTGRETVVFVPSRSAYIREDQGKVKAQDVGQGNQLVRGRNVVLLFQAGKQGTVDEGH